MSRPTYQQLETLADFLMQNPGIAKGLSRTAYAKRETKRKWNEIAISLNALGGAQKDGKSWAKYWADKKCALKKTCAQHAQSMRRTGAGVADNLPILSPIDQQLVAVMGGPQFAVGDSQVAVNPFPSTSNSQNQVNVQLDTIDHQTAEINEHVLESSATPNQNVETVRETIMSQSPVISNRRQRSRTLLRSRTILDQDRDRFEVIERQIVEAETTTARALAEVVQHMAAFRTSIDDLSTAIRDSAQMISNALSNIANALQHN